MYLVPFELTIEIGISISFAYCNSSGNTFGWSSQSTKSAFLNPSGTMTLTRVPFTLTVDNVAPMISLTADMFVGLIIIRLCEPLSALFSVATSSLYFSFRALKSFSWPSIQWANRSCRKSLSISVIGSGNSILLMASKVNGSTAIVFLRASICVTFVNERVVKFRAADELAKIVGTKL